MAKVKYDDEGNRIGVNLNAYTPEGKPKYVRVYDNGGESIDRYTVVFSQLRTGWCYYLAMNGAPFHPQGFCQSGEAPLAIDYPTYGHLGKKITFDALPEACQRAVMQDYRGFWGAFPTP